MDWYYTWNDIREYFALDDLEAYVILNWKQCDLRDIRDLPIDDEGLDYLLYRDCSQEEYKQKILRDYRWFDYEERDLEYLNSRWGSYEKDYEIRPFYISYYGWWNYRVQFCEAHEAQWMILIKRRKIWTKAAEEIIKKTFEHYVEWDFLYVQVYSPHDAYFAEGEFRSQNWITFWDYEDGGIYYMDEDEALSTIPDYAWEIIKETENMDFEAFELIPKKTDNQ